MDAESADWLANLAADAPGRDAALRQLHSLLLRVTRAEAYRRAARFGLAGPEVDDLAHQAADDALVAILRRLGNFRGESRFTTWAYKFAILEVASKVGRHFWTRPTVLLEPEQWDQLPARLGVTPESAVEAAELVAAVRSAVDSTLTLRQRTVFTALVVDAVPVDVLVERMATDRNSLYQAMFEARRKIRAALADVDGPFLTVRESDPLRR
jgi:RNA polymerase sigma-70 factor (ECF subfamily)